MDNIFSKKALELLSENYQWIFSGLGVSIITFFFLNKQSKTNNKQIQKSGKNSKNIQISNIDINNGK